MDGHADAVGSEARVREAAERHGFGRDAAYAMLRALEAGGGRMAQFSHPEFGGMGQWSAGGMIMLGAMNDHALKARVSGLCADLAPLALSARTTPASASAASAGCDWWPKGLGQPSSVGAQNASRYAVFPGSRRLAIETGGRVAVYDTGEHVVTGVSQQQGGSGGLALSGPDGPLPLDAFRRVDIDADPGRDASVPAPARPGPTPAESPEAPHRPAPSSGPGDPLALLERLAELHRKGVLTEAEFVAKKTELLARL